LLHSVADDLHHAPAHRREPIMNFRIACYSDFKKEVPKGEEEEEAPLEFPDLGRPN
jgi:hypothetical protein